MRKLMFESFYRIIFCPIWQIWKIIAWQCNKMYSSGGQAKNVDEWCIKKIMNDVSKKRLKCPLMYEHILNVNTKLTIKYIFLPFFEIEIFLIKN